MVGGVVVPLLVGEVGKFIRDICPVSTRLDSIDFVAVVGYNSVISWNGAGEDCWQQGEK